MDRQRANLALHRVPNCICLGQVLEAVSTNNERLRSTEQKPRGLRHPALRRVFFEGLGVEAARHRLPGLWAAGAPPIPLDT